MSERHTFAEFQASRRRSDDISWLADYAEDVPRPGYTYLGDSMWIEEDLWWFSTVVANDSYFSPRLEDVEVWLYHETLLPVPPRLMFDSSSRPDKLAKGLEATRRLWDSIEAPRPETSPGGDVYVELVNERVAVVDAPEATWVVTQVGDVFVCEVEDDTETTVVLIDLHGEIEVDRVKFGKEWKLGGATAGYLRLSIAQREAAQLARTAVAKVKEARRTYVTGSRSDLRPYVVSTPVTGPQFGMKCLVRAQNARQAVDIAQANAPWTRQLGVGAIAQLLDEFVGDDVAVTFDVKERAT